MCKMYDLYVDEDIDFKIEVKEDEMHLLHLTFNNYSHNIHKKFLNVWNVVQEELILAGIENVYAICKSIHFCNSIGLTNIKQEGNLGVFVWEYHSR